MIFLKRCHFNVSKTFPTSVAIEVRDVGIRKSINDEKPIRFLREPVAFHESAANISGSGQLLLRMGTRNPVMKSNLADQIPYRPAANGLLEQRT
jgi:hypothetical protein